LKDPLPDHDFLLSPPGARAHYTGVGSRSTPDHVAALMKEFAACMASSGWILRSGAADGADSAFESGVTNPAQKEIFLPYPGFNGSRSTLVKIPEKCYEIAKTVHPAWERCSSFARKAHARNVLQVLGQDLESPSSFLVCWTADGAIGEKSAGRDTGGTRTAIVLAERNGIPVINVCRPEHENYLREAMVRLLRTQARPCEGEGLPCDDSKRAPGARP
jgi:hypothetical protein